MKDIIQKAFDSYKDNPKKALELASLVAWLYSSGTRISTTLELRRKDFNLTKDNLIVWTKPEKYTGKFNVRVFLERDYFTDIIIKQLLVVKESESRIWKMCRATAHEKIQRLAPGLNPNILREYRIKRCVEQGKSKDWLRAQFGWSKHSRLRNLNCLA